MNHSLRDEAGAIAHVLARTGRANGDDAAMLRIGGGATCISTDSTISGVHAPLGTAPHALGRRAAARAISDIAAMGAMPFALTCAVHVPEDGWDEAAEAIDGVRERALEQGAELVGGDFTRTRARELALVVTVLGRRAGSRAAPFVMRSGLRPADLLVVTGHLGAAADALARDAQPLEPPDRIRAGIALAPFATAMVDLSDGLARDVAHLATASNVSIDVDLDLLTLAPGLHDPERAASGGDDYELLLGIAPGRMEAAAAALHTTCPELPITTIGAVTAGSADVRFLRGRARVELGGGFVHV
jgi:thiamine-monophosphate kinase